MMSDFIHYAPESMARYPLDMEPGGVVIFDNLDSDAQEDVIQCVFHETRIPSSNVKKLLRGTEIPVWLADPALLIGDEGRDVRVEDVERYGEMLSEDLRSMPPVIIDSDAIEYPLCEGGHRTVAAIQAGLSRIYVIDVAGIRITSMGKLEFRTE